MPHDLFDQQQLARVHTIVKIFVKLFKSIKMF